MRGSGTACCFGTWAGLVARNRFRVGITRWPLASTITMATLVNSLLRPLQELLLARYLQRIQIKDAPIFIIGHWRSGTTLLHELLVLDGRYTYPTTYQCLCPNHFLISTRFLTKLRFLLPGKRPMDNMSPAGTCRRKTSSRCATWACRRRTGRWPFPTNRRSAPTT